MNNRITELINESTVEIWGNNQYNGSAEFEGLEVNQEKFAELIIKECLDCARGQTTAMDVFNAIKNHFGVE